MTLSGRIFVGLFAGVATGLFFGELVADLKIVGDIFIKLLQITVLPYIVVSLIAGFGRMDIDQARLLALRGGAVLVLIWAIALLMIFAAAQAFPDLDAAGFFGTAAPMAQDPPNLMELYLPANIFYSLSQNFVPAVVLFSLLVGIALISVENKDSVLPIFDGMATAMARINSAIVKLTPYGIFAVAAAAAGTMTVEEVARVQVYLVTYISLALFVTFWAFPALVAAFSDIPYRDVLHSFRDPLVTAFATGNQFVVLPQIAENCKELLGRHNMRSQDTDSAVDIIVPVSFNFPSLGKLLVLLFVLFAAWFTDADVSVADSVSLAFNGLFSLFGSINVAVPYLLETLQVPSDMFQLFLVTGIVVGRFGAMLAALHIVVLSVLGALALSGRAHVRAALVVRYFAITGACLLLLVLALRAYFYMFVPDPPPREEVLRDIHLMEKRVPARVFAEVPAPRDHGFTVAPLDDGGSRLDHIMSERTLTVGYRPKNLPCSYVAPDGDLVGFDVEMAHILAQDMGVNLEFVPFRFDQLGALLSSGQIDIAMSCIAVLPDRNIDAAFSRSYLDLNLALIVRDHEQERFADVEHMREVEDLTIALVSTLYYERRISDLVPDAKFLYLESAEEFFLGDHDGAHALLLTAEEGAAYAYRYPEYAVVRVGPPWIRIPGGYPLPRGDTHMVEYVSNWIDLQRKNGTIDRLHEYWMLGGAEKTVEPRWSVIRDVLGWVE